VIPIVATGGKYIKRIREREVRPHVLVCGEKDVATIANLDFKDWDYYLTHFNLGYDVMVVQYLGRGMKRSSMRSRICLRG